MMAQGTRTPRTAETREASGRPMQWRPPETLPSPNPVDGYVHRWIRLSTNGADDIRNIGSRRREGWEPVNAKDYPELSGFVSDRGAGEHANNLVIGGLVLCRISAEIPEQRNAWFQAQSGRKLQAVNEGYLNQPTIANMKTQAGSNMFDTIVKPVEHFGQGE